MMLVKHLVPLRFDEFVDIFDGYFIKENDNYYVFKIVGVIIPIQYISRK